MKSNKLKDAEATLMKLESGTPIVLLRKNFLKKDVNTLFQSRLIRFTGRSIAVEIDGKVQHIPTKFIDNSDSNINSNPPVIHLPTWFHFNNKR